MLPRDHAAFLDILEQIEVIEEYMDGVATYDDFSSGRMRRDAVVHRIEIIGEAMTRISPELRGAHQEIPWQQIRGMRNFLSHVYDQINYRRVWEVTQHDLMPLKEAVEKILSEQQAGGVNS